MKHTFIYLGCEVKIADNRVSIYRQDGSMERIILHRLPDHDSAEEFVNDYITLSIVKQ
jgi:hypothetical protein